MNIQEMHNVFRTIGQQMGLQTNRGILPESIDIFLNDAIIEKIQQELLMSVHTALQDSVNTQSSTMSSINTFRTLYRTVRYGIDNTYPGEFLKLAYYNADNGFYIINIPTVRSSITIDDGEYKINPMMFLGFSLEYENTLRGNAIACRLIGSDVLETTLRDYCNGASKDSPIVVLNSVPIVDDNEEQGKGISNEQLEVYTGTKGSNIKFLNIKYIKQPNIVKYDTNIENCVNCDLPEYTHFDIVERAVAKFYASMGMGVLQQQPRQQRQQ